jgi:hypothetical protein
MALPGPAVRGPAALRLTRGRRRDRRFALAGGDDALGELVSTSTWKNQARAEAGGEALELGREGFLRRRTVGRHPGTSEEVAAVGRGGISAGGDSYGWKRERGWRGGPWLLLEGDRPVAKLRSHSGSKDRRVALDLVDGAGVPVLLLLVCCFVLIADDDEGAAAAGGVAAS